MNTFIEKLKEVRQSPRKMQEKYLRSINVFDEINRLIPNETWKIKEKIDVILENKYLKCYCGNILKVGYQYCSNECNNNSRTTKEKISHKNTENASLRMEKTKKTLQEKYGVNHVQQLEYVKEKTRNAKHDTYDKWRRETFTNYGLDYDKIMDKNYLREICKETSATRIAQKYFNGMPLTTVLRHIYREVPDIEFPMTASGGELEVRTWLESLGLQILTNDRTIISPYELDIYLPDYNLAIEYNGLYYHSNDKKRHIDKFNMCENKGIQLIQIFEDEWCFNESLIKSIILSKIGKYNRSLYARNTVFKSVDRRLAIEFLNDNHIQGFIEGKQYGLFYDDELVSIMTVGKTRFHKDNKYEIYRFCSKQHMQIVGAFSKLLKNIKLLNNINELYTFADLRFSTGKTYANIGKFVSQSEPGYFWTDFRMRRINRFQTQKHKLKDFLGKHYDENETEESNMIRCGFSKIYDCGNRLYIV